MTEGRSGDGVIYSCVLDELELASLFHLGNYTILKNVIISSRLALLILCL